VRLEATLAAGLLRGPLVTCDDVTGTSRANYIGRTALIVTPGVIIQTIAPDSPSVGNASQNLVTLLSNGCLSSSVRVAVNNLPESAIHTLVFQASLLEGGSQIIRFLEPALHPAFRQWAALYARLAVEAAKPFDLQHWLTVLPENYSNSVSSPAAQIERILIEARTALLCYEYAPIIDRACLELGALIRLLFSETHQVSMSWPVALGEHLEQHKQQLIN
jgi:hypothetical protein